MTVPTRLRAEHVTDGVVSVAAPRLSWQVRTDHDGWVQSAYRVRVSRGGPWSQVEPVAGPNQVLVPWPFEELGSREVVEVSVRV